VHASRPFALQFPRRHRNILFIAPYLSELDEREGENTLGTRADLQFQFARRTLIREASGRLTFDGIGVLSRLIPAPLSILIGEIRR